MQTETYYIKKGRKYIPFDRINIDGVGEGLWLVTKQPYSKEHNNV